MGRVAVFALLLIASVAITEAAVGRNLKADESPCDGQGCPAPCIELVIKYPTTSPKCDGTSTPTTYNIINKCKTAPDKISYVACYTAGSTDCTKVEEVGSFPYSTTNPYSTITLDCGKDYKCILHDGSFKNGFEFSKITGAPACAQSQKNKCPYCIYDIKPECPPPTPCKSDEPCVQKECKAGQCVTTYPDDDDRCGDDKDCSKMKCVDKRCKEVFDPNTKVCRPQDPNNPCDAPEYCPGDGPYCGPNYCVSKPETKNDKYLYCQ